MIIIDNFNTYWAIAVNGIFTGLGVALGTYIANAHIIERVKQIRKIKRIRFEWKKE